MGENKALLIEISSKLFQLQQELEELYRLNEHEGKRNEYHVFLQQIEDMKDSLMEELDGVDEYESYTGTLDKI
ncbi:MAG TPA: hypothetical protein GX404_06645 [Syntrophomonadaceae bacterium]|jgi:hypothetical protein|nr:hypothetical protein [Syntrophomonadaceae bacterium]